MFISSPSRTATVLGAPPIGSNALSITIMFAKVFCKYATDAGLNFFVLTTARVADLAGAADDHAAATAERIINGHQIIAVRDENGKLRAFDPGLQELRYIKPDIYVGSIVKFRFDDVIPHVITAILTPAEYNKIDTYKKLRDLYVNGKK